jgi:hypothetical protein
MALGIASSFNWHDQQFWCLYSLASLFHDQGKPNDAHTHIECAKLHAVNEVYSMGRAIGLQAQFWYDEHKIDEARSGALYALGLFEGLGATDDIETCQDLLQKIEGSLR